MLLKKQVQRLSSQNVVPTEVWRGSPRRVVFRPLVYSVLRCLFWNLLPQVKLLGGVSYDKVSPEGLHIRQKGKAQVLPVDTVVVCAGQQELDEIYQAEEGGHAQLEI